MTESLPCSPETTTMLLISYESERLQYKIGKVKKQVDMQVCRHLGNVQV